MPSLIEVSWRDCVLLAEIRDVLVKSGSLECDRLQLLLQLRVDPLIERGSSDISTKVGIQGLSRFLETSKVTEVCCSIHQRTQHADI